MYTLQVKNISFSSYNVKDFNDDKIAAVKYLFKNSTFLLLQETWLNEKEFIRKFKSEISEESECISANKMDHVDFKRGRRYGGVSICYHSNIKCKVENIPTRSKCICVQKITIDDIILLLINVYMPSSDDADDLDAYSSILQEISSICVKNLTPMIIIGGDFNADPSRNDGRTRLFKDFIRHENLCNALDLDISDVPYTFSTKNRNREIMTSTIDHFLISPALKDLVRGYKTEDEAISLSDHIPIMLHLNMDVAYLNTYKREFKPSVAWPKCRVTDKENYRNDLDQQLLKINPKNEVFTCKMYKCQRHRKEIQELHDNIVGSIKQSSGNCLPHTSNFSGKKELKVVPRLNEHLNEHAINAKYWNDIWIQQGKPRNDGIARMRWITKLRYHYAV